MNIKLDEKKKSQLPVNDPLISRNIEFSKRFPPDFWSCEKPTVTYVDDIL